jgi:hypothetical protein
VGAARARDSSQVDVFYHAIGVPMMITVAPAKVQPAPQGATLRIVPADCQNFQNTNIF